MGQVESVRTALVTGGAQGIGREICFSLAEDGMKVFGVDIDGEAVDEMRQKHPEIAWITADMSDDETVQNVISQIDAQTARLDVLVNNAAIVNPNEGPLDLLSVSRWQKVIQVNLTGPFLCCKYALPLLRRDRGAVVNIASTRALQSEAHTEAYAASKGALVSFTHALAVSEGPAVRVNCVSPGWIATGLHQKERLKTAPIFSAADHAQHPAGRVGMPADIAKMVSFLASPGAGFITGQNIVIDGGMTRKMIYVE